jgi:hypothetical protein
VTTTATSGSQVTINLTGVPNASRCSITVQGVTDGVSPAGDVTVPANFLLGDITADGFVNVGDTNETKSNSGSSSLLNTWD